MNAFGKQFLFFSILLLAAVDARAADEILFGADLSSVLRLEHAGAEYRVGGTPADPLELFRDHGFGAVRLRLWHSPDEPWHGLDSTLAYAVRARAAGHAILLDFHYSDTWADPGHQTKPAGWEGLEFGALVDSLYAYTHRVVLRFRDAGAVPACVQIGNEIDPGFLWNDGRVGGAWETDEQWTKFTTLLSAAAAAVRDSLPPEDRPKIMIHISAGGDNGTCRWFYDRLLQYGVEFDVIGLSFYPWWHGTLADLESNLNDLASRYGKDIQVVETAYPWTLEEYDEIGNIVSDPSQLHAGYPATPAGQLSFLRDLAGIIRDVPDGRGTALYYWEPAYLSLPGVAPGPWENMTLFDFDGDALPGLGFPIPASMSVESTSETGGPSGSGVSGRPNPFQSGIVVSYTVPDSGAEVTVAVYDVRGRIVATLVDGGQPGGVRQASWSGLDGQGRPVGPGAYFCRIAVGGRTETRKVLLVR